MGGFTKNPACVYCYRKIDLMNKLFAVLLGGRPADSSIEAHNVYFGVAEKVEGLFPAIKKFWPSAPKIHIDAWMQIGHVDEHEILLFRKDEAPELDPSVEQPKLFFMNLGAYDEGILEERHKKLLIVAKSEADASVWVKAHDPFFEGGYKGGKAATHIDDKKTLDEFEDDSPMDVGSVVAKQGFALRLRLLPHSDKRRNAQPAVNVTGFWKVP